MTFAEGFLAGLVGLTLLPLWYLAVALRTAVRSITWLVEGTERRNELEREKLSQLAKIAAGGDANGLATRLDAVESGHQSTKLLVADAVERVTALANRVSARQRRAADDLIEDEDREPEPSPEQREALAQLLRGAGPQPAAPAASPSNLTLKQRSKLKRQES